MSYLSLLKQDLLEIYQFIWDIYSWHPCLEWCMCYFPTSWHPVGLLETGLNIFTFSWILHWESHPQKPFLDCLLYCFYFIFCFGSWIKLWDIREVYGFDWELCVPCLQFFANLEIRLHTYERLIQTNKQTTIAILMHILIINYKYASCSALEKGAHSICSFSLLSFMQIALFITARKISFGDLHVWRVVLTGWANLDFCVTRPNFAPTKILDTLYKENLRETHLFFNSRNKSSWLDLWVSLGYTAHHNTSLPFVKKEWIHRRVV